MTLGWRRTPEQRLLAAAQRLAQDVYTREATELTRLIGDTGDTRPAEVKFSQPPEVYWRTDGGTDRGSLFQIQDYYQQLRRGRLVAAGRRCRTPRSCRSNP